MRAQDASFSEEMEEVIGTYDMRVTNSANRFHYNRP